MYISSIVLAVVAFLATMVNCDPAARLVGGQEVDTLRQFPHHVVIIPFGEEHVCGGSILNDHWILTSAACIKDSPRLELHFGRKKRAETGGDYFTVSVNSEQIYVYPTNHDDLALVRIPMKLVFSDTIQAVDISTQSIDSVRGKFAVLPGFNEMERNLAAPKPVNPSAPVVDSKQRVGDADNLKYGMFKVLENSLCQRTLASGKFEEYSQICTEGWGSNPNTPCDSDFGSGLLAGWPANSKLIGMFSSNSPSCDREQPAVYTFVPKYSAWIKNMIKG